MTDREQIVELAKIVKQVEEARYKHTDAIYNLIEILTDKCEELEKRIKRLENGFAKAGE